MKKPDFANDSMEIIKAYIDEVCYFTNTEGKRCFYFNSIVRKLLDPVDAAVFLSREDITTCDLWYNIMTALSYVYWDSYRTYSLEDIPEMVRRVYAYNRKI